MTLTLTLALTFTRPIFELLSGGYYAADSVIWESLARHFGELLCNIYERTYAKLLFFLFYLKCGNLSILYLTNQFHRSAAFSTKLVQYLVCTFICREIDSSSPTN